MSTARKLLHTRYRVNDLEGTVKFYKEVLGLQEVRRHKSPRGSELAFLKAPESEELIEICSFPKSGRGRGRAAAIDPGRPNSGAATVARVYDLVMTHKLDADDLFIHTIQRACAKAHLNFFLIEPLWVERFYECMDKGEIWCRVLLNMQSEHHQPDEAFHKLVRLAAAKHVQIIDPPDVAQAAFDKARLHPRLIASGIHVPHTIFVAKEQVPDFKLSEAERQFLGEPFVIKPAMGYGRKGVIMDGKGEDDLKRSAE